MGRNNNMEIYEILKNINGIIRDKLLLIMKPEQGCIMSEMRK